MNCKPGQMATIVRGALMDECVGKRLGSPVKVVRLIEPTGLISALWLAVDGPVWEVECPLSCPKVPQCDYGLDRVPDACLQPFEPDSTPEADAPDADVPVTAL